MASPWTRADLGLCGLLVALGLVLWFLGWYGASDKVVEGDQVVFVNLAAAGTLLAGAGFVNWFLHGRRAIRDRRRRLILVRSRQLRPGFQRPVADAQTVLRPRSSSAVLVAAAGLARFHRSDCALAVGRDWPTGDRTTFERAGQRPCGVCLP